MTAGTHFLRFNYLMGVTWASSCADCDDTVETLQVTVNGQVVSDVFHFPNTFYSTVAWKTTEYLKVKLQDGINNIKLTQIEERRLGPNIDYLEVSDAGECTDYQSYDAFPATDASINPLSSSFMAFSGLGYIDALQ